MGVFDDEKNLPGVITQIESDYSYDYDTSQFNTTDSVAIIGTAFNGPVGQPVPVYSVEHAAYIFGGVYDSVNNKEATLVANIQDAWDRGCRTIYGVRIGGKEMYKDFEFAVDSSYRLRVSSMFPANVGKQCFLRYDATNGAEVFTYYKPANRATISEKKQGIVESADSVIVTDIKLGQDYGLNHDSRLVDIIRTFNAYTNNNVLKLMIVDLDGNDVTNTKEVYNIPLGVLYPGVYFIGRDKSLCNSLTETQFRITSESDYKPYTNFDGAYFRRLVRNTDVSQPIPIYDSDMKKLRATLKEVGITTSKSWDFLETAGVPDLAFEPNDLDYEETDLTAFETYQRLGEGFATTAKAERRVDANGNELRPRIRETSMDDTNHIVAIGDGIYSTLQDAEIDYRVLTSVTADQSISGKLPRAEQFQKAMANDVSALKDYINITPKIDEDDRTSAKKYAITFQSVAEPPEVDIAETDVSVVYPLIAKAGSTAVLSEKKATNGTLVMATESVTVGSGTSATTTINGTLYHVDEDGYTKLDDDAFIGKKYIVEDKVYVGENNGSNKAIFHEETPSATYVLGSNLNHVFVYKNSGGTLSPVCDFAEMISGDDNDIFVYAESLNYKDPNKVIIQSATFHNITLEELVSTMNEDDVLSRLFEFDLTEEGAAVKDDFVSEILAGEIADDTVNAVIVEDREIGYDYNLYIPYRTTDNFARHLAQHCTYTELKTAPTKGFIGCSVLSNTGLAAVASKVNSLMEIDFNLYAKNAYGRNMLDRDNMPYNIGRNVNVVFGQYGFNSYDDSYYFTSNGAAGYAGMVSILPLDQSSTSQSIDIPTPDFFLSSSQLLRLTDKGFVTFRNSFTKGIVVTDGITMAPSDSEFRRLSVSRIIGSVEELIRAACEPYIGKQNHAANRDSLYTAIKSRLQKLVGTLLEDFTFKLMTDSASTRLSVININYQVIPIGEIREIRNLIKVTDSITE